MFFHKRNRLLTSLRKAGKTKGKEIIGIASVQIWRAVRNLLPKIDWILYFPVLYCLSMYIMCYNVCYNDIKIFVRSYQTYYLDS